MVEIASSVDTPPSPHRETRSTSIHTFRNLVGSALFLTVPFISDHKENIESPDASVHAQSVSTARNKRLFPDKDWHVERIPGEITFSIGSRTLSLTKWHVEEKTYGFETEINGETVDSQIEDVEITPEGNLVIHFNNKKGCVTIGAVDVRRIADIAHEEYPELLVQDIAYSIDLGTGYNEIYKGAQYSYSAVHKVLPNFVTNHCVDMQPMPPLKGNCSISVVRKSAGRTHTIASAQQ